MKDLYQNRLILPHTKSTFNRMIGKKNLSLLKFRDMSRAQLLMLKTMWIIKILWPALNWTKTFLTQHCMYKWLLSKMKQLHMKCKIISQIPPSISWLNHNKIIQLSKNLRMIIQQPLSITSFNYLIVVPKPLLPNKPNKLINSFFSINPSKLALNHNQLLKKYVKTID